MNEEIYTPEEIAMLMHCKLCPRECGVNRFEGSTGYCRTDAGMNIASICIHRGEEPPISGHSGICNIFFAGCNLRCKYCQNYDISRPEREYIVNFNTLEPTLNAIEKILSDDVKSIGFVSPSHAVPQVKAIIRGLNSKGLRPITVYNTNSYDKPETIDSLAGMINVWLPDYKYVTSALAEEYSDATDYPEVALKAIKRMYYQKGSTLQSDKEGRAANGILIRHLVLPGHSDESKKVLENLANELSPGVHLSLMSQYHPTPMVSSHPDLKRILYRSEYSEVVETMENLGFRNGWIQEMESSGNYRPDFRRENPFG